MPLGSLHPFFEAFVPFRLFNWTFPSGLWCGLCFCGWRCWGICFLFPFNVRPEGGALGALPQVQRCTCAVTVEQTRREHPAFLAQLGRGLARPGRVSDHRWLGPDRWCGRPTAGVVVDSRPGSVGWQIARAWIAFTRALRTHVVLVRLVTRRRRPPRRSRCG